MPQITCPNFIIKVPQSAQNYSYLKKAPFGRRPSRPKAGGASLHAVCWAPLWTEGVEEWDPWGTEWWTTDCTTDGTTDELRSSVTRELVSRTLAGAPGESSPANTSLRSPNKPKNEACEAEEGGVSTGGQTREMWGTNIDRTGGGPGRGLPSPYNSVEGGWELVSVLRRERSSRSNTRTSEQPTGTLLYAQNEGLEQVVVEGLAPSEDLFQSLQIALRFVNLR